MCICAWCKKFPVFVKWGLHICSYCYRTLQHILHNTAVKYVYMLLIMRGAPLIILLLFYFTSTYTMPCILLHYMTYIQGTYTCKMAYFDKPVDPDPVQWLVTYMYLCMYLCLIDVNALVFPKNIHQSLVYKRVQHVYTGLGVFLW